MKRSEEKAKFLENLVACYQDVPVSKLCRIANSLYRAAATLHRMYEIDCSVDMNERQQKHHAAEETRIEAVVHHTCAMLKLPYELNGDPRGASVKVRLPNGRGNGWETGVWYI